MKENKISKNKELRKNVKKLLAKAKDKKLIKPHILAFDDVLVSEEEHKGKIKSFR